jgi:Cu(I)/Ag(I) efflux system membrane fusion protein
MKIIFIIMLLIFNGTIKANEHNHTENIQDSLLQEVNYTCPMHPSINSHKEGNCPICGMNLILQKEKKIMKVDKGYNVKTQNFNIKTGKSQFKSIIPKLSTFGTVKYNEDYIFHLHSRYKGWIQTSNSLKVGDYIKKDQLLYTIYSQELLTAQQDFLLALKNENKDIAKFRLKALGVQEQVIQKIKRQNKILEYIPVYSENDGLITELKIQKGLYIEPSTKLLTTINPNKLWIEGILFENDYIWADIGNDITLHLDFLRNDIITKIDYIYPNIDNTLQGFKFRGSFNNIKNYIKSNQNINITVSSSELNGIVVPYSSLIQTEQYNKIIIQKNNSYEIRNVKIGYIDLKNQEVIIKEGLEEDEEIVISGHFLIDAEASIQGSVKRINGDNNE